MGMPTDIGIVDLGMGFPYRSIEEKKAAYDFFKANLKDRESLEEMEFPAQYMFKDVPDVVGARRRPGPVDRREDGRLRHRAVHDRAERRLHPGQGRSTPAAST